jgi:hypothetical protein
VCEEGVVGSGSIVSVNSGLKSGRSMEEGEGSGWEGKRFVMDVAGVEDTSMSRIPSRDSTGRSFVESLFQWLAGQWNEQTHLQCHRIVVYVSSFLRSEISFNGGGCCVAECFNVSNRDDGVWMRSFAASPYFCFWFCFCFALGMPSEMVQGVYEPFVVVYEIVERGWYVVSGKRCILA